jgi:hypothetical protein
MELRIFLKELLFVNALGEGRWMNFHHLWKKYLGEFNL